MNKHVFDESAWAKMTMFEQMGNIGSEVGRAFNARQKGDERSAQAAFFRGLDLIDATAALWSRRYPARNKELLRARELFAQNMIGKKTDGTLEQYFTRFAVAARIDK